MMEIEDILKAIGPARSSRVVEELQNRDGITAEAARKRISRIRPPVYRFPIPLLPKREAFLYLKDQRPTELMWTNFLRDMRDTGSAFSATLDAIAARGGIVAAEDFPATSGAPKAMRAQVTADQIERQLVDAGVLEHMTYVDVGDCYRLKLPYDFPDHKGHHGRKAAEQILLEGLKDWARKIGFASYNSIAIRGDERPRTVGPFSWDLTGASYLMPLRRKEGKPGFFVADVFAEGRLDEHQIQFFIRKARLLRATMPDTPTLAMLVAPEFTGKAMTAGHAAGVVLATPQNLFGLRAGRAISTLVDTLRNAAAVASANPGKLGQLIDDLSEIEGAAGNIRGVLFELISFYLARMDAVSGDFGVNARDPETGKTADIDVLVFVNRGSCVAIECKGKEPGGTVEQEEVEKWLTKLPTFRAHLKNQQTTREAELRFEIWTSGEFSSESLALLQSEKQRRTKTPIDWRDGEGLAELAKRAKEKAILNALNEHYLKHPLATLRD